MQNPTYRQIDRKGNGRPVVVGGTRTAFVKSFGVFEDCECLELFVRVIDGLVRKLDFDPQELDNVIAGTVIPQTRNPNVARDAILSLGLPAHIHGYTLNRACTSSMQTIIDATQAIRFGHPNLTLAGGDECLSDVPIVYSKAARKFMVKLSKAKSTTAKLNIIKHFNAKAWLPKPPELAEPLTGLTMGEHCEIMAVKNNISREDQDAFALESHRRAAVAMESGFLAEEIVSVWPMTSPTKYVDHDNVIRRDATEDALVKLRPAFDRKYGTLTAGNSSPLTDGAAVCLIADEQRAKEVGLNGLAEIVDYDFVGVDPRDQLLIGPAYTIPRLLKRNKMTIADVDRFEIHEAFAAQVLSCLRSMASAEFCERVFGWSEPFGEIPMEKLNVNGGAIAIGHPFGATGARLVTTAVNELVRSSKEYAVIGICAAGGMAGSMLLKRI